MNKIPFILFKTENHALELNFAQTGAKGASRHRNVKVAQSKSSTMASNASKFEASKNSRIG